MLRIVQKITQTRRLQSPDKRCPPAVTYREKHSIRDTRQGSRRREFKFSEFEVSHCEQHLTTTQYTYASVTYRERRDAPDSAEDNEDYAASVRGQALPSCGHIPGETQHTVY